MSVRPMTARVPLLPHCCFPLLWRVAIFRYPAVPARFPVLSLSVLSLSRPFALPSVALPLCSSVAFPLFDSLLSRSQSALPSCCQALMVSRFRVWNISRERNITERSHWRDHMSMVSAEADIKCLNFCVITCKSTLERVSI
jgi:hypothetical protein